MRQNILDINDELIIDNFAGGGGASTGIRMCGNSVCPPLACALVYANVPEMAIMNRKKYA